MMKKKGEPVDKKELFDNFQNNWMRLLSPFEIEDINKWIDEEKMPVEVVNEALKSTILYNAPNLRYLNRVLNNWKRQGIDTVEKVEFARLQFENKKLSQGKGQLSNVPSWSNPDYRDPTYDDLKVNPSEVSDGSGDF
ncbi:TPA: DnaD domain protein [Streptococcus pyogenes]|uniref:DnaD domain-containing protein n=1 Tax=Streptococcus pyogenes TaxID=1314 RepID=UPI0015584E78|nr:DnaD domain protein [Streptococcus pyogenes]HER4545104.1 DnaD domain protein [Streptococcus pyogenes NGAS675]HER4548391.1 DnaD domain protein [Streptococcus pyogenes NGAS670]HER4636454.1 DnaD domain protein [Streptococcus pyogenes NGAS510]HER4668747.1 DnaD domain protein [Streptococcus pyogenes NGAS401]HER4685348.1 DnaD domain protein [Streptococcus pyogenes NGAS353]HER4687540.1 DnaD domain protein [Streptococcus pyogenes NGAS364]HER4760192.1 DnaD domain protein [Streptococcus pyogenes NG